MTTQIFIRLIEFGMISTPFGGSKIEIDNIKLLIIKDLQNFYLRYK